VQYFVYPGSTNQEALPVGEVDMSALDQIEKQIANNAQQYAKKQEAKPVSGQFSEEVNGLSGEDPLY
jgi:hypothetical protein